MTRMALMAALVLALAAPGLASAQRELGSMRKWVDEKITPFIEKIKDPKVKEALEDARKAIKELKQKVHPMYPQYRAILSYVAVAASKVKDGANLEALLPLIAKIKEAVEKIGPDTMKAVKDWIQKNKAQFKGHLKVVGNALKKGARELRHKVVSWWKKMMKDLKKSMEGEKKEPPKKE
jgi:Na+/phosphate symporter